MPPAVSTLNELCRRWTHRCRRSAANHLGRRPCRLRNRRPLVSFTFDDFPRSALETGGAMLERHGLAGTYYASLGLMGQIAPTGRIFDPSDLAAAVARGHEVGCHTFDHRHAYDTPTSAFETSVLANRRALEALLPGSRAQTLSYPISYPRLGTKLLCARYFRACRGGGQDCNAGIADLGNLKSFFLEQARGEFAPVAAAIERNRRACGWLIFSTHDISDHPTRFGCTPGFFDQVVRRVLDAGAEVLRVSDALDALRAAPTP